MNWYRQTLSKYAVFSGRARRKEYWVFFGISVLIMGALQALARMTGIQETVVGNPLIFLYSLAIVLPSISVAVRRLHDTGRTGWWLLLGLVPIIGAIIVFIFMVLKGDNGDNSYGPNPKRSG